MKTLPLLALALAVLAPGAAAQTATLAEDIAEQEAPYLLMEANFLQPLGQSLFFIDTASDEQPWVTDGTVDGTRMLSDACPDPCNLTYGEILGTLGDRIVYLWGQLWSTDGTPAGTVPLTEPALDINSFSGADFARLGDRIYFAACLEGAPYGEGCGVWSTDGTRAGTGPVPMLPPGPDANSFSDLTATADRVYFLENDIDEITEIWAADAAGARRVLEIRAVFCDIWTAWGNLIFFTREFEPELWVTDGTPAGTRSVGTFAGGFLDGPLATGPGGLYFIADDGAHGEEIWRSDGTREGTRRVTEIDQYDVFSSPFSYTLAPQSWAHEIGGRLLFAASDAFAGTRLWISTGKPASTRAKGPATLASRLFRAGNRLFAFIHDTPNQDCEVWSFDGQGNGTRLVDGLSWRCSQGFIEDVLMRVVGSRVYFIAQDGDGATWSVWRSDGTAEGTARLFSVPSYSWDVVVMPDESRIYVASLTGLWLWDARNGPRQLHARGLRNASSNPADLAAHQGRLAFTAGDGTGQPVRTVWSSQGSEADTSLLVTREGAGCDDPGSLLSTGSQLVFVCGDEGAGDELRSAAPGGGSSTLLAEGLSDNLKLIAHEGRVWFAREDDREVWTTDGTPAGTVRLADAGGSPLQVPIPARSWALSDGQLVYFLGTRPGDPNGRLWRSDGTPAGTIPLVDLPSGYSFEVARAGSTTLVHLGDELWRTDGTPAGTVPLTRSDGEPLLDYPDLLTGHNGAFYAYAYDDYDKTFWRTDGTEAGTVSLVGSYEEYDSVSLPKPVGLGEKLLFVALSTRYSADLWATDGTLAGTLPLTVALSGFDRSPAGLVAAGGAVWFTAFDRVHGRELWRTDGTAAGTRLVQDIAPGARSSSPDQLTEAGGRLYFTADDGITGRELWSLPLAGPGACAASDEALCLQGGRFHVESRWRDFQGNRGSGRAVPLTGDTGTFWFFSPSNVEVLLKVLDGRGLNDHFWVFYGALSSVEYALTVTDTQTGLARRYSNPAGQLASAGDTQGFGPLGAQSVVPDVFTAAPSPPAQVRGWSSAAATAPCAPGAQRLCLNGGRFAVEVSWKDFQGKTGKGTAIPFSEDTGFFWFFDQANVELAVKVLDGRPLTGKFWVFYGALSNVEYTLTVTDSLTGEVKEYRNPSGRFASVADTGAF